MLTNSPLPFASRIPSPQSFTPLYNVLRVFPQERKIVSRELWGNAYRTSAYYLARVLCELPLQVILPCE